MILNAQPDLEVIAEAGDGAQAITLARQLHPDVVVMDTRMPVLDGVALRELLGDQTSDGAGRVRVLILTAFHLDEYVVAALRAGRAGSCSKMPPPRSGSPRSGSSRPGDAVVAPAVTRRLLEFTCPPAPDERPEPATRTRVLGSLTGRETDVLRLVARGLSNTEIAAALVVTETTIKTHVHHLLTKLAVLASDTGLVRSTDADQPPRR